MVEDFYSSFVEQYNRQLAELREASLAFDVSEAFRYDVGVHPESYVDLQCEFAARALARNRPAEILDVGSYRHFVLGLLASYPVTTLDVRSRKPSCHNEIVLTGDAKQLDLPSSSFDAVVSLCAIEHFGLGRYGDEFDIDADKKGVREMIRVLKPGGSLIFTTSITRGVPSIAFNAHKDYDYAMIEAFCGGLSLEEDRALRRKDGGSFCSLAEVRTVGWDVYCGCWRKQRYSNLFDEIDKIQPRKIMEIGTWNGDHARLMINRAQDYRFNVEYYGFDLFERNRIWETEFVGSKRPAPAIEKVRAKLEATGAKISLTKGDTNYTLYTAKLPVMDFVFVDGGHSVGTISNDWETVQRVMGPDTVVIFDDYYPDDDEKGCKAVIQDISLDDYNVEIMEGRDTFNKSSLCISLVKVTRK